MRGRGTAVARATGAGWLTLALLLAACGGEPAGPPQVRWGLDECSHCHMILAEERFAAVARAATGEEARFDDLGCAVAFLAQRAGEGWEVWVHDAAGPEWLAAPAASFAATGDHTPMGSGLLAFASPAAAAAAGGDGPLTWEALLGRGEAALGGAR